YRPARSWPHRGHGFASGISPSRASRSSRLCCFFGSRSRSHPMSPDQSNWSFFAEHRAEIFSATLDHMALVVIAMILAILICVPLGMFIVQRPTLRAIALAVASIFQTVPSLALFGFLVSISFIGYICYLHDLLSILIFVHI